LRNREGLPSPEQVARGFRRLLGIDDLQWLDPMTILMKLRELRGCDFATVSASEIAPSLAKWDSSEKLIRIGAETFAAANFPRSEGRARFSIFHEVVHALSGDEGEFNRLPGRSDIPAYAQKLRALEARTDKITAALMAPRHLIHDEWSVGDVSLHFGMSDESAGFRIEEIRDRPRGVRTRPDSVTQLLLDLSRRNPR
jgi:hypothetical protein